MKKIISYVIKIRESIDILAILHFMKNQLHVGTKADLSFNLRHFWPMKSFRRLSFWRKTDCFCKISDAVQIESYDVIFY